MNTPATWRVVQEDRAKKHREFCVQAANKALAEFKKMGVEVVVFGSLSGPAENFRDNSDIDLCILDRSGVEFSLIEDVALKHLLPASYDLVEFNDLKPAVKKQPVV